MKKTILSTILFFFLVGTIVAQEGVKFGLKVNPIISFATITDSSKKKVEGMDLNPRAGYQYGLIITYGFNSTVGIYTGVQVTNRGFAGTEGIKDSTNADHTIDFKQNFTTLEIPVALKLRSPEIGTGIHIMGIFGATAEINISNRYNTQNLFYPTDTSGNFVPPSVLEDVETRDSKRINLFTTSFIVGAGVDWQFDWGMIHAGASYHMGLINILNKKHASVQNRNAKMSYVALDLAYFF